MRLHVVIFLLVLLWPGAAFCRDLEGKYFTIRLENGVEEKELLAKLNRVSLFQLDALGSSDENALAVFMDALYLEVCDQLDIHIYDMKITLNVLPKREEFRALIKAKFGKDTDSSACYVHNDKAIYAADEGIRPGVLAHEISHAILMRYFVVPPPEKLQEIMCGYVEYSINKKINNVVQN